MSDDSPEPRAITDEDQELGRERELSRELDALSARMLDACEAFVFTRTAAAFEAWTTVNAEYVEKHRRWWALAMPDVPYESVFGAPA